MEPSAGSGGMVERERRKRSRPWLHGFFITAQHTSPPLGKAVQIKGARGSESGSESERKGRERDRDHVTIGL